MKHSVYDENGRRVAVRMCVACRERREKSALFRVVKEKGKSALLDEAGNLPGRGAYVCKNRSCIERAAKIRALERGIKGEIPKEIYEVLLKVEE
ncbi:MAG: hypothetical protein BWY15_01346 [Firmicutes bacterium ADurb.Bin193]|nr:MAG: hypothetical protein BWY15_01346 [Firmicutes bacterium ADurb.Bin193]